MKPGLVYFKGSFRTFTEFREIQRGKNTGRVEVQLREARQHGKPPERSWAWATVKRIVSKDEIRRFPQCEPSA